jgi:rare lipoprotein A
VSGGRQSARIPTRLRWGALALVIGMAGGCGSSAKPPANDPTRIVLLGKASYYHDSLHGNPTASGEPYDRRALTAAHRQLPFGTVIRVTNLENGRSVQLRINDRGPFVDGRIVDVSRRAAEDLDFVRDGVVDVRLEVLSP